MLLTDLPCVFFDNVLCKYRKGTRSFMMVRCWECRHYKRFSRVMLLKDGRVMDEIDKGS